MLFLNDIILICVLSAVAGAGAAVGIFFFFKGKGKKNADDMKPSDKKNIILGIRNNAEAFADLLEPLFLLASGRTERKDEVLDSWYAGVDSVGDEAFKNSFVKKCGEIGSFKGKKKKYIKCANKILKYVYKAGIEREDDETVTADEKTAERYDIIGTGSIEAGKVYDVFVPYWELEIDEKDENGEEIETETILCKGAIR